MSLEWIDENKISNGEDGKALYSQCVHSIISQLVPLVLLMPIIIIYFVGRRKVLIVFIH